VARGILRAAAAGCRVINLSLSVKGGAGSEVLADACEAALEAGCVLVASVHPDRADDFPAALPGVISAVVDDALPGGAVREVSPGRFAAPGRPRDLAGLPREANLWGSSFACARVAAHLAATGRLPAA
jgi:hypothetical protein